MHVRGAKCASSVELLLEAEGAYSNKKIIIKKYFKKYLKKSFQPCAEKGVRDLLLEGCGDKFVFLGFLYANWSGGLVA